MKEIWEEEADKVIKNVTKADMPEAEKHWIREFMTNPKGKEIFGLKKIKKLARNQALYDQFLEDRMDDVADVDEESVHCLDTLHPDELVNEIYEVYRSNPKFWTLRRLSYAYKMPRDLVGGYVLLKNQEREQLLQEQNAPTAAQRRSMRLYREKCYQLWEDIKDCCEDQFVGYIDPEDDNVDPLGEDETEVPDLDPEYLPRQYAIQKAFSESGIKNMPKVPSVSQIEQEILDEIDGVEDGVEKLRIGEIDAKSDVNDHLSAEELKTLEKHMGELNLNEDHPLKLREKYTRKQVLEEQEEGEENEMDSANPNEYTEDLDEDIDSEEGEEAIRRRGATEKDMDRRIEKEYNKIWSKRNIVRNQSTEPLLMQPTYVIPGQFYEEEAQLEKDRLTSYTLEQSEYDERKDAQKIIDEWALSDELLQGERHGFVNEQLESIIIKKGFKSPEEVSRDWRLGQREHYVVSDGGHTETFPTIIQELDGTIRTATPREKEALSKAVKHPNPKVTYQDRFAYYLTGKKITKPHVLHGVDNHIQKISLDDFIERKRKDPEYYLKIQTMRRAERNKQKTERALQAYKEARYLRSMLKKRAFVRAYYEPKGMLKYNWSPTNSFGKKDDEPEKIVTNFQVSDIPVSKTQEMKAESKSLDEEIKIGDPDDKFEAGPNRQRMEKLWPNMESITKRAHSITNEEIMEWAHSIGPASEDSQKEPPAQKDTDKDFYEIL
eukprot:TRINITY_DN2578_c0_g2_i1.p1 TRINITY_DN2578_c0_g2~~TRINITY_DN2578_c0_g2_i1.p1  ORF type:complete len:737 (-),score=290.55 TRINITY_DN2578_c0_g2_i1:4-2160(-)